MSIFAFVGFFAFGAGPVVWTYCSEMFPPDTRARNVGFTTCANWLGNLLIAQASRLMRGAFAILVVVVVVVVVDVVVVVVVVVVVFALGALAWWWWW